MNGEKHGKGKLIWLDMSAYEGDWEYGKMTGDGMQTFPNGKIHEG